MSKVKNLLETAACLGMGESTIRKYIKEFPGLIPMESGHGRRMLFSSDAMSALELIRELYKKGKSVEEISLALEKGPKKKKGSSKTPQAQICEKKPALEEAPAMMMGYEPTPDQDDTLW